MIENEYLNRKLTKRYLVDKLKEINGSISNDGYDEYLTTIKKDIINEIGFVDIEKKEIIDQIKNLIRNFWEGYVESFKYIFGIK